MEKTYIKVPLRFTSGTITNVTPQIFGRNLADIITCKVDLGASFIGKKLVDMEFSVQGRAVTAALNVGAQMISACFIHSTPNGAGVMAVQPYQVGGFLVEPAELIIYECGKNMMPVIWQGAMVATHMLVEMKTGGGLASISGNFSFIVLMNMVFEMD